MASQCELELISKLSEEHRDAGELHKVEEIGGVVFPAYQEPSFPLEPRKEPFDKPTALIAAEVPAILGLEVARPFAATLTPLDVIPGVSQRTIEGIVGELGLDLSPFPSDRHLVSWTALCPGHHESAGKQTSGKPRK